MSARFSTLVNEGRIQGHIALSRGDNARSRSGTRSRVSAKDREKRVDDAKFAYTESAVSNIARGRKLNFLAGVDRSITKFAYASFSPCRRARRPHGVCSTLLALLHLPLPQRTWNVFNIKRSLCLSPRGADPAKRSLVNIVRINELVNLTVASSINVTRAHDKDLFHDNSTRRAIVGAWILVRIDGCLVAEFRCRSCGTHQKSDTPTIQPSWQPVVLLADQGVPRKISSKRGKATRQGRRARKERQGLLLPQTRP